jgi:hypothetical protein
MFCVKWGTGCVGISSALSDGSRQARGRSVRHERLSGNGKEGRLSTRRAGRRPAVSWMLSSDEHCLCGIKSTGSLEVYAEGCVIRKHREPVGRIRVMIVQERALMAGETMRMVGRTLVSFRSCFR